MMIANGAMMQHSHDDDAELRRWWRDSRSNEEIQNLRWRSCTMMMLEDYRRWSNHIRWWCSIYIIALYTTSIGVACIEATEAVASVKKNKIKIKKNGVFNLENNTSQYYWLVVLNRVFHVLFSEISHVNFISLTAYIMISYVPPSFNSREKTRQTICMWKWSGRLRRQLVLFHANDLFPPYEGWKHGTEPPWQKTVLMG